MVLARLSYLFVAGELFASGPMLQGDAQWTRCSSNDFSGNAITEWWRHTGWELTWVFAWR